MWPFKKREEKTLLEKATTKLEYDTQSFEVGKAEVLITLEDGRTVVKTFEGWIYQSVSSPSKGSYHYVTEFSVEPPQIHTGEEIAKSRMRGLKDGWSNTYASDDGKRVLFGKVLEASIVGTYPFQVDFAVARVVKLNDEK